MTELQMWVLVAAIVLLSIHAGYQILKTERQQRKHFKLIEELYNRVKHKEENE